MNAILVRISIQNVTKISKVTNHLITKIKGLAALYSVLVVGAGFAESVL
jgi:hypothetical protein